MPTYVYRCKSCGHQFEAWQHMTDDPLTTCPQCGAAIHRVVFPTGILFKGSGFYTTDSRKSEATGATGPSTPVGSNGAGNGSSQEAPAAKSDATGANGTTSASSETGATSTAKESKTPAPATTSSAEAKS